MLLSKATYSIQTIPFFFFISMCSLGIEPTTFCTANTMLYHWATGTATVHLDLKKQARKSECFYFNSKWFKWYKMICEVFWPETSQTHSGTHPLGLLPIMAVRCSEREVFITFELWTFILQKCMDSLCEGCFITVRVLYFKSSEHDPANTCLVPLCKAWRGQDNFLYNSDWIRLKEKSHIHLGCFEAE